MYTRNDDNHLISYNDSDYAGNIIICWSITEYVFYLTEGLIAYKSSLFKTVTLSITESEYMVLCMAVQKVMWIKGFFNYISYTELKASIIYEDN